MEILLQQFCRLLISIFCMWELLCVICRMKLIKSITSLCYYVHSTDISPSWSLHIHMSIPVYRVVHRTIHCSGPCVWLLWRHHNQNRYNYVEISSTDSTFLIELKLSEVSLDSWKWFSLRIVFLDYCFSRVVVKTWWEIELCLD